jgi:hypothetical protein
LFAEAGPLSKVRFPVTETYPFDIHRQWKEVSDAHVTSLETIPPLLYELPPGHAFEISHLREF